MGDYFGTLLYGLCCGLLDFFLGYLVIERRRPEEEARHFMRSRGTVFSRKELASILALKARSRELFDGEVGEEEG